MFSHTRPHGCWVVLWGRCCGQTAAPGAVSPGRAGQWHVVHLPRPTRRRGGLRGGGRRCAAVHPGRDLGIRQVRRGLACRRRGVLGGREQDGLRPRRCSWLGLDVSCRRRVSSRFLQRPMRDAGNQNGGPTPRQKKCALFSVADHSPSAHFWHLQYPGLQGSTRSGARRGPTAVPGRSRHHARRASSPTRRCPSSPPGSSASGHSGSRRASWCWLFRGMATTTRSDLRVWPGTTVRPICTASSGWRCSTKCTQTPLFPLFLGGEKG